MSKKRKKMSRDEEFSNARGSGRGEYYRNKYGRGGNRRGGRGGGGRGRSEYRNQHGHGSKRQHQQERNSDSPTFKQQNTLAGGDGSKLASALLRIDGSSYGAYKKILGEWDLNHNSCSIKLSIDRVQSDPYASPSRVRCFMESDVVGFPKWAWTTPDQRIALGDYLTRMFTRKAREKGVDQREKSRSWGGAKGGDISMDTPGQHVLERTSVIVGGDGSVEARFTVGLPARGRTVLGKWAKEILCDHTPMLCTSSFLASSNDLNRIKAHVESIEDQEYLRKQMRLANLAAFVANGSILPRASGNSDKPMDATSAVAFESPKSLEKTFQLPHAGPVTGMGLPSGISLIVGGGFHGKSTLLSALEKGVYNHVPGDGREFVCVDESAVKIRAEDGRCVNSVNISPFIDNLPFGRDTANFSTQDASGSTSQAANIIEALEMQSNTLLVDEDTCATNFMIRDSRMAELVSADKEPIKPFISKVRPLYEQRQVSSILVIGGAGDYFDVADTVVMMDCYKALDVTARAKAISASHLAEKPRQHLQQETPFGTITSRNIISRSLKTGGKVMPRGTRTLQYGNSDVDLSAVEQLVEGSQVNAIANAFQRIAENADHEDSSLHKVLKELSQQIDTMGLDVLTGNGIKSGNLVRPRLMELAAALNRYRGGRFILR